jgi:hypothetical protein
MLSFVLAFTMVMSLSGVKPLTVKATDSTTSLVKNGSLGTEGTEGTSDVNVTTGTALKMQIQQYNNDLKDMSVKPELRLEIGDTFSVYIATANSGSEITNVKNIKLHLLYDSDTYETVTKGAVTLVPRSDGGKDTIDTSGWSINYYPDSCNIEIDTVPDTSTFTTKNIKLVKIDFKVKKAVEEYDTSIGFDNAYLYTTNTKKPVIYSESRSVANKSSYRIYNSVRELRSFILSTKKKLTVNTSSNSTTTTLMLKVLKDSQEYYSVYNGCTIEIEYDPSVLTLKSIGPSDDMTGVYGNAQRVDDTNNVSSGTYDNLQTTDGINQIENKSCKVRYTMICADKNIDLFNKDLIKIVFTPMNGYEKKSGISKDITIKLLDVSNLSGTTFTRTGIIQSDDDSVTVTSSSAISSSAIVTASLSYDKVKKGDVNLDKQINLIDVTNALRAFNKAITLSEKEERAADVDGNGELKLTDVVMILKYVNSGVDENSRTFPAGWVDD